MKKIQELNWKLQLDFYNACDDVFFEEEFAAWEKRIRESHQNEIDQIQCEYDLDNSQLTQDLVEVGFDPDEIHGEHLSDAIELTNKMYAALLVALWSRTESRLNYLATISIVASGILKDSITKLNRAYEEICDGEKSSFIKLNCIAKSLQRYSVESWKFDRLISVFRDTLDQNLTSCCPSYEIMNDTRLLCNAFKHNGGILNSKFCSQLSLSTRKVSGIEPCKPIEYSSINLGCLITGCRDSLRWISKEIRSNTHNH